MAGYFSSEQRPVDAALGKEPQGKTTVGSSVVHNQPYDESLDVSDGEEIASATPTPREMDRDPPGQYRFSVQSSQLQGSEGKRPQQAQGQRPGETGGSGREVAYTQEEEDSPDEQSESEESEEGEEGPHMPLTGAYDPNEYEHLQVGSDLKELFQHIRRYTPQTIELDTKLRPFIPEYIPAVGDIDAFLKVALPDSKPETLGLTVLDEPRAKQSDPTVLDLQLRTVAKQTTVKPMTVHSIANPDQQTKEMENWIESISEIHRQKPATNVHYTKNMPDIETLMQEWPPGFEDALRDLELPSADLDCDLSQYTDIICSLLDIPVYKSRVHSLHVLFSLYMEFKNSQHFKNVNLKAESDDDPAPKPEV